MRPAVPIALLFVTLALAGCFGERSSPVHVTPFTPINDVQPGRWTEYAFRLESTLAFKQTLGVRAEVPEGWEADAEVDELTLLGRASSSLVLRVKPDANASYAPTEISVLVGDTRARVVADVRDLAPPALATGMRATVLYAYWWENGTLASTNDPALRNRTGIGAPVLEGENGTFAPRVVTLGSPDGHDAMDARLLDAGGGAGMMQGETLTFGPATHPVLGERLRGFVRVVDVDPR